MRDSDVRQQSNAELEHFKAEIGQSISSLKQAAVRLAESSDALDFLMFKKNFDLMMKNIQLDKDLLELEVFFFSFFCFM